MTCAVLQNKNRHYTSSETLDGVPYLFQTFISFLRSVIQDQTAVNLLLGWRLAQW